MGEGRGHGPVERAALLRLQQRDENRVRVAIFMETSDTFSLDERGELAGIDSDVGERVGVIGFGEWGTAVRATLRFASAHDKQ